MCLICLEKKILYFKIEIKLVIIEGINIDLLHFIPTISNIQNWLPNPRITHFFLIVRPDRVNHALLWLSITHDSLCGA